VLSCKECPAGWIVAAEGKKHCEQCDAGKTSGSSVAVDQLPQNEGVNQECQDCATGKYIALAKYAASSSAGVQGACDTCPSGWTQPTAGSAACEACTAGKHGGPDEAAKSLACKDCEGGKYQTDIEKSSCTTCDEGKFRLEADTNRLTCKDCPTGWRALGGQSECTECPSGWQANVPQSDCTRCPTGRYGPDSSGCQDCGTGKFQSAEGMSECSACANGKYQPDEAEVSCINCPAGWKSASSPFNTVCQNCPASQSAAANSASCATCPSGKYTSTAGQICADAEAGHIAQGGIREACPAGQYQASTGQTSCEPCCAAGSDTCTVYSDSGASQCAACPAGRLSQDPYAGSGSCLATLSPTPPPPWTSFNDRACEDQDGNKFVQQLSEFTANDATTVEDCQAACEGYSTQGTAPNYSAKSYCIGFQWGDTSTADGCGGAGAYNENFKAASMASTKRCKEDTTDGFLASDSTNSHSWSVEACRNWCSGGSCEAFSIKDYDSSTCPNTGGAAGSCNCRMFKWCPEEDAPANSANPTWHKCPTSKCNLIVATPSVNKFDIIGGGSTEVFDTIDCYQRPCTLSADGKEQICT
jgi:hypothetical protein